MKTYEKRYFSFSVVLPAYNEAKNIEKTVSGAVSYLTGRFERYEVMVVNV